MAKEESLLIAKFDGQHITEKKVAKNLVKYLSEKQGCTEIRIQEIDLNQKYTIKDMERCIENWGLCKVERPYIKRFLDGEVN